MLLFEILEGIILLVLLWRHAKRHNIIGVIDNMGFVDVNTLTRR